MIVKPSLVTKCQTEGDATNGEYGINEMVIWYCKVQGNERRTYFKIVKDRELTE